MKLIQYTGPFTAGQTITISPQQNYSYVHIGIQIPERQPIAYVTDTALTEDIELNGIGYRINDKGILEFDELAETGIEISIKKNLPWESIIDIMYDVAGA